MNIRFTFLLFFMCCFGFAQNQLWGSYFSYTGIVDMAQNNGRIYAASESAVFSQNVVSGELKTLTSVDGLKAETITSVYYSTSTQRFLVGNSNGLLFVVNPDGTIITKIDIVQETNILTSLKNINSIYEYEGMAYLSCGFGIVVFNMETLQFGDTYYIGNTGGQIGVNQCAVHSGYIYAATQEGLKRAPLTANLINFSEWSVVSGGTWRKVLPYQGVLFAVSDWNTVYTVNSGTTAVFTSLPTQITDFRVANGFMLITCATKVVLYDNTLTLTTQINTVNEPAIFTKATYAGRKIYIGTSENGVYSIDTNSFNVLNITPNGPLRSNIFSLEKTPKGLWAVYGGYSFYYTPNYSEYGASMYTASGGWTNIKYNDLTNINSTQVQVRSISDIAFNPNDEKQVYLFSTSDGVLKLNDMVPEVLYNPTNSTLENLQTAGVPSTYYSVRVRGGVFDSQGKLWMMNSKVMSPLKVYTGSGWNSYSFENVISEQPREEYSDIVIDRNNTKWIGCYNNGIVAYNETMGPKFINITTDNNLPDNYVRSLALDNSGRLWIGTNNGLRVLYTTEGFMTEESLDVSSVIFEEDGVAQELMYEQAILDIEVDGSNNKWFATVSSGAYLVSPDGQRTLYHFTKENSPLPSNNVNDIAVDSTTGEVFFATDKGMVSFKGTSTAAANDLSRVYAYPNPVRPGFDGDVKITNLTDKANVKITDIEGNLVYETTSEGGTILWDTSAFGKYKVRSGVYMVFISTEDASQTAVRKVMIIRGN